MAPLFEPPQYEFKTLDNGNKVYVEHYPDGRNLSFEINPYTLATKRKNADGVILEYKTFSTQVLKGIPRRGVLTRDGRSERILLLRVDEHERPMEEIRRVKGQERVTKFTYSENGDISSKSVFFNGKLYLQELYEGKVLTQNYDGVQIVFDENTVSFQPKNQIKLNP